MEQIQFEGLLRDRHKCRAIDNISGGAEPMAVPQLRTRRPGSGGTAGALPDTAH